MKVISIFLMAGLLSVSPAAASPLGGQETYDLLFRNGTLDTFDRASELLYEREVTNTLKPEAAERDTGAIALSIGDTTPALAHLEFRQDDKYRGLGRFPASVGNPMIMFFYETVVRDMAETLGGSPSYIRNRVKESLIQPSDLQIGEAVFDGETIETRTVQILPFENDPNKARMFGFGDMVLTVTMSEAVPGWYVSLLAEVPGEGGGPVYRSELRFDRLEDAQ